jgi:hypothetical protein
MVEKSGGAVGTLLDKGLKGHEKKKVEVILKKLGVPQL